MDAVELITDEEMQNLPEAPAEAFAELERICRNRMQAAVARMDDNDWKLAEEIRLTYYTIIAAAGRHYEIPGLNNLGNIEFGGFGGDEYRNFLNKITSVTFPIRLKGAARARGDTVSIDTATEQRIRVQLKKLRDIISDSNIDASKKASLLKKLGDFEVALHEKRVNLAKAMKIIAAVAFVLHEGGGALEDARKCLDGVAYWIGKAGEAEDAAAQLKNHSAEQRQLPSPNFGEHEEEAI